MRRHAFTLIELLVVVSIIALLVAMLLPSMKQAVTVARALVCESNQRQLTIAWLNYPTDHQSRLTGSETDHNYPETPDSWVVTDANTETVKTLSSGSLWTYAGRESKLYLCPTEDRGYIRSYSIANYMNGHLDPSVAWRNIYTPARTLTRIVAPAQRMVFVDDDDPRGHNYGSFAGGPWSYWQNIPPSSYRWGDWPAARHGDLLPLSYADGHAEIYRYTDAIAMRAISWFGDPCTNPEDFQYIRKAGGP